MKKLLLSCLAALCLVGCSSTPKEVKKTVCTMEQAGLDVNKNAFYAEDKNIESLKERRNILAVKEGNENTQKIKDLTEALTSEEVRDFINEKYKGAVVPVF